MCGLARPLLTSISTREARTRAVLNTVILFWPNMAARPRRTDRTKPLRLACWNAEGARGKKLEAFSQPARCRYLSLKWDSSTTVKPSNSPIVCHRTDRQQRWYNHPAPPWYNPPLSAHFMPDPLGVYCHPGRNGRQTGENPCGIPLPFPPTERSGTVGVFRWGNAGLDSRRPQCETRRLELAAEHKTRETPARLCRREFLSDLWTGHPNH